MLSGHKLDDTCCTMFRSFYFVKKISYPNPRKYIPQWRAVPLNVFFEIHHNLDREYTIRIIRKSITITITGYMGSHYASIMYSYNFDTCIYTRQLGVKDGVM